MTLREGDSMVTEDRVTMTLREGNSNVTDGRVTTIMSITRASTLERCGVHVFFPLGSELIIKRQLGMIEDHWA